ncbi:unnamed protein product [Notodromas monacha]|uniref:ABC transporter domain-containing protein n=2 Tax=Notodromas monacha TaxID=399045 RepID=A0A7R9GJS0_9CRUS|nr:unnamed protein product [Notodromas monacha]CAG0923965.1 unnamed protein product [Notodromas monacha]
MKAFPGTNVAFIILPHTPPNPKERCYTFVLCTSNAAVDTYLMTETEIRSSAANSYRLQWAMNLVNNENMLKHDEDMISNPDPRQQAIALKLQDAAITYDKFSVSFRRREIFVYVIICTYLFYMPIFLHPLALEKKLGIKDIFRAMGVSRMQYWLSWWTIDGAIVCIITLVILCCLYIPVFSQEPGQHMFSQQPKYLILLLLLAHGFEIIAFTCLIANVCPNSSFGVTVGLLFRLLIASLVSEMAVYGRLFDHPLYALVPSAPMYILMEPARGAASRKNDLEWMAMTSVMVYMVLFCLLACYAEPLVPGKFGEKMSPGYLFDKSYWTGEWGPSVIKDQKEENDKFWRIQEIQQAKRPNVLPDVAIVAENLHKDHAKVSGCSTCRNSTAMKGISFVALDNQITVFLGKNHSGKTTLMHTLAGFCRQSSGSIRVYKKAKETPVGICPYADYLYPELTPREHLYLYGGLREIDWGVVGDETTVLLDIVHLLHRRHDRCGTLSFALRRLVSLLAAVVGRPRLIMIDQPSEGTDRQTQNALWTLLKVLKEDRTIVFTTQSAKEASALGDRIVMIHKGENVISGSMAEIEAALIPGQPAHLVITPAPGRNAADTDILIRTAFPSAFLLPCTIKNDQLIYQYNPRNQAKLLMDQIEAAKGELGVQTVKMGSHDESYEDETAFLLAGEMPTPSAKRPRSFSWAPNPAQNLPDASVSAHLKAELWKKGLVALRRKWLIMFQLAAIILAAIVIMISANKVASDFAVSHLREDSPDSTTSNHAAKLQNADKIITCGKLKDLDKEKTSSAAGEWYAFQVSRLVIPICLLVCSFSWGPTDERVKQTKQLQLIASLKPGIYWLTHFLGDMTLYCLALCLMTLAVLAIDAGTDSILIPYTGVFMLIFVTFGIAGILMAYCASFLFNGRTNSIAALMFLVVVGDVLYYINEVVRGGGRGWLTRTLAVLPTFCVLKATDALARTAFRMQVIQPIITNYTGLAKVLPLEGLDCIGIGGRLDSGTVITIRNLAHTHRAMFEWGNEVSLYLLILAGSSILLLTCLVLFEVFGNFGDFTCGTKQYVRNYEAAVSGRVSDDYVGEEADRIESLVASEKVHEEHLVVANVFKRFQRKLPIRGISFGVHYGECFGLLGVNGAGKTLVFKIVSGWF